MRLWCVRGSEGGILAVEMLGQLKKKINAGVPWYMSPCIGDGNGGDSPKLSLSTASVYDVFYWRFHRCDGSFSE